MGGASWSRDEKILCLESKDRKEFMTEYLKKFGTPTKLSRIDNIWKARAQIRDELRPVKPVGAVTTPLTQPKTDNFPDIGNLVSAILGEVRLTKVVIEEMVKLQREQLELFKRVTGKRVDKDEGHEDNG